MASLKLPFFICFLVAAFLAVDVASGASHSAAPSPAVDCSSLVLNVVDCLSYITNGSSVTKPEGSCCSGLKLVLKTDAACLCEALKSSGQLGIVVNVTKATSLPDACKLSAPSISNCQLSIAPAPAPATTIARAPSTDAGGSQIAPVPASVTSSSSMVSISVLSLVMGLVVASFF